MSSMVGHKPKLKTCFRSPISFNDLADQVLVEILHRLPLITAHRYKLVCKRWHSVISEPYFARRFSQREKSNSSLLFLFYDYNRCKHMYYSESGLNYLPTNNDHLNAELCLDFINSDIIIEASFNDLLLYRNDIMKLDDYFLCNPVTRRCVQLPRVPRLPPPLKRYDKRIGLIASENGGEFALTVIRYMCDNNESYSHFNIQVLSSKTLKWIERNLPFPKKCKLSISNYVGVPCKGFLFWIDVENGVIIGIDPFNISGEKPWHFIDTPRGFITCRKNVIYSNEYLGVCRKSLRLCQIISDKTSTDVLTLRIWDLKDSEWTLCHHVELSNIVINGIPTIIQVQACHLDDPDVIYIINFVRPDLLIFFNISAAEVKVANPSPTNQTSFFGHVIPYTVQWKPTPLPRFDQD